jgi:hypothetical protein
VLNRDSSEEEPAVSLPEVVRPGPKADIYRLAVLELARLEPDPVSGAAEQEPGKPRCHR